MQKFGSAAAMLLVASVVFAFQAVEPAKSPYERRGLYHATVRGRILSQTGEPVAGVHVQLSAGRPRSLPLMDVVTGADGRFATNEVNSIYPPYLRWFPPEEWMDGGMSLAGESGEEIDVGTVRLQPNTVIRVAVELVGGTRLGPRDLQPTVVLKAKGDYGPRVGAENIGSERVLSQIPFDDGEWEISLFANSKSEYYRAPFHVQRGRRDQKFNFRLLRDTLRPTNEYESEGKMEITETVAPVTTFRKEFHATGRILGPDGSPIEGAIVNTFEIPFRRQILQWVRSGTQGDYDLRFLKAECSIPAVSYGDSDYWNPALAGERADRVPCEERLRAPLDVVMPLASRLSVRVEGIDASSTRAYW